MQRRQSDAIAPEPSGGGHAPAPLSFVLVTPARNEAAFIDATIRAVLAQTLRPMRWIIVSDGSTDGTDDIVRSYCAQHPWIQLVRVSIRKERSFAGKVHAFNAGWARLHDMDFDVVGSLDADITFEPQFFEVLIGKLAADPRLGVVGAPFVDAGHQYDYRYTSVEHVSGACQLFRRECFEDVGGFVPVRGGGVDWIAVTTARMKGWRTRTFAEVHCRHHRVMGTAQSGRLRARFVHGRKDYRLGGHPLWQLIRGVYQFRMSPVIGGGLFLIAGFYWELLRNGRKDVDADLQQFHRTEQMRRLRTQVSKVWPLERRAPC